MVAKGIEGISDESKTDDKSQEILDLLLATTPEDRLRRKLERQWKAYHNSIIYIFNVFTFKRKKDAFAYSFIIACILR